MNFAEKTDTLHDLDVLPGGVAAITGAFGGVERTLARELHDIVAHGVGAMLLQAAGAKVFVGYEDERVRQSLSVIEAVGIQAMSELHGLLGLLRTVDEQDMTIPDGTNPSLDKIDALVDLTRASGLDVQVAVDGERRQLAPSVSLAAYRIVQESLTNTLKHAGQGAPVRIHLVWSPAWLNLSVRDSAGPAREVTTHTPLISSGQGLRGLSQRVSLVGGRLTAEPVAGGFLVTAQLPVATPVSVGALGEGLEVR